MIPSDHASASTRAAPPDANRPRLTARVTKWVLTIMGSVAALAIAAGVWAAWTLSGSLPATDGRVAAAVGSPTTITRDGLGMVTITGTTRRDVAFATGYAHAQDRFFQMDLARRRAAGELSALVGRVALEIDRRTRVHRFRALARHIVTSTLRPDHRELLGAYTEGVNAGLRSLARKPFEYYLLRTVPAPWMPEDSLLTLYSMFLALQSDQGAFESDRGVMHDLLPSALFEFLTATGGDWDKPFDGVPLPTPQVPPPTEIEPGPWRTGAVADPAAALLTTLTNASADPGGLEDLAWVPHAGSNNWVVAGTHTASGHALVANDMHLDLTVPHIWYRASLVWGSAPTQHAVTGVTLPGTPAVVVGSNTNVAWGFTNSEGDWSDLVLLESPHGRADSYLTPAGVKEFVRYREAIDVKGEGEETLDVRWTEWGPVIDKDHRGRLRALRWTAHDSAAVNFDLLDMETARTVSEAIEVAHRAGIPAQNMVVGDRSGSIGWTIAGRIPRRVGCDGTLPQSWASGACGWQGYVNDTSAPRLVDPPTGFIATANNRVASNDDLRTIGVGRYDEGARETLIVQALARVSVATPADMLAIQLDDHAVFLERWRRLAMRTLDAERGRLTADRETFRALIETSWTGRASVESTAYRLVRTFRAAVADTVLTFLTVQCKAADPRFTPQFSANYEGPVWRLVNEQPAHLLDPQFASWQALLLGAVDRTVASLRIDGEPLDRRTWGERNRLRMRHPLSAAIPWFGSWLDMPSEPMPGDAHMPRVQGVNHAASERMAVAPGREDEGYLHMPGGQSGHPWSPHYRDGHDAWVKARAQPFLPGAPLHTLVLEPANH